MCKRQQCRGQEARDWALGWGGAQAQSVARTGKYGTRWTARDLITGSNYAPPKDPTVDGKVQHLEAAGHLGRRDCLPCVAVTGQTRQASKPTHASCVGGRTAGKGGRTASAGISSDSYIK